MRKLLFLSWDSAGEQFVIRAFESKGLIPVVRSFPKAEADTGKREKLATDLVQTLLSENYEFVFTVNYLPVVAIACKACKMKYVSWIYDSPCVELYSETVSYETNYIFVFDKKTCMDLWEKDIQTVYYLPMAADVAHYDTITGTAEQKKKYQADISFVGSLYSNTPPQFKNLENLDDYGKGYLDALIRAQKGVYGLNFLESALTPQMVLMMQKQCLLPQRVNSSETTGWLFANYYLAKKVTGMERTEIINLLSQIFTLKLYTAPGDYSGIINMGMVDYYTQAPLVFKNSSINLNISLRSIQSAMPLRVFDIMGCGGFLLSNFQADFLDFFVPGEDFVYYENYEDLLNKAAYYLEHDDERARIARNGYEKVKDGHTYEHRVDEILQVIES